MFENCKNTKAQGNIGIAYAIAHYVSSGYTVSIPMNDSQEYDLVVDIDGFLNKVQVKTTGSKTPYGIYTVTLRNCGGTNGSVYGRVNSSSVDLVFILTASGDMYEVPLIDLQNNTNSLNLGDKALKYKITKPPALPVC